MSLLKTEIAQNKLTTSISEMNSNKKFLLGRVIVTAVPSNKYWKLNQFSKVTWFLFIIISFVRHLRHSISSFYENIIGYVKHPL